MNRFDNRSYLIALFGMACLIFACQSNPAIESRYTAEKLYFQADRLGRELSIKPELTTAAMRDQVIGAFHESLTYSLSALAALDSSVNRTEFIQISALAHRAATRLSKVYYAERKFDTCIAQMTTLLDRTVLGWEEQISVYINLAHALQASGRFDSAIAVYNTTINRFKPPVGNDGKPLLDLLNLPMFLVGVFAQINDTANTRIHFERAERYYREYISDSPASDLATASHGNLARMYYDFHRWDESIAQLEKLVDSTGEVAILARFRIADIRANFQGRFEEGKRRYDEIFQSLTGSDTLFKPVALFKKSLIEMQQENYNQARLLLVEIQQKYPGYYRANAQTQYVKARSFDMENNWARAETEYKFLIEQYSESREALATYLYLAKQLEDRGRSAESQQWYDRAEQAYTLLAARGARTQQEARAITYKADLYRQQERWNLAAETLISVYSKFPDSRIGRESLLGAASIYRERLKDPNMADSLVAEFKKNLPSVDNDWES